MLTVVQQQTRESPGERGSCAAMTTLDRVAGTSAGIPSTVVNYGEGVVTRLKMGRGVGWVGKLEKKEWPTENLIKFM